MIRTFHFQIILWQFLAGISLWAFTFSPPFGHIITGLLIFSLWDWVKQGEDFLRAYHSYYLLHLTLIISALAYESGESLWLLGQFGVLSLASSEGMRLNKAKKISLLSLPLIIFLLGSLNHFESLISWSGFAAYSFFYSWELFKNDNDETLIFETINRYFYHDLFNHIHGLYLFLQRKSSLKENIESKETEELIKEMKNLMSVLSDHTGFKHKNFISSSDWESVDFLLADLSVLAKTYAPELLFKWDSKSSANMGKLHRATFFRIMTNLIKNLHDHGHYAGVCEFRSHSQKLEIIMTNKLRAYSKNPDENTRDLFKQAETQNSSSRLGLDSIAYLIDKSGGELQISLVDNCWRTTITLPFKCHNFTEKTAA